MVDKGFYSSLCCHVAACTSALELGWAVVTCLLHKSFWVLDQNHSVSIPALRESPSFTQNRISSDLPGVWMLKLTFTRQSRYVGPRHLLPSFTAERRPEKRLRPPEVLTHSGHLWYSEQEIAWPWKTREVSENKQTNKHWATLLLPVPSPGCASSWP